MSGLRLIKGRAGDGLMRAVLLLLIVAFLAGCVADDEGPSQVELPMSIPDDWAARAVPWDGHDHYDPAQHQNLSSGNFELLGWDPLVSGHYGHTAGGHLCGDATDAGARRLAVVHGISTDVAFVLIDVTDPAAPTPLGEFILPRSSSRDVSITPDGRYVAVALSTPDVQDPYFAHPDVTKPTFRGVCGDVPLTVSALLAGPEQDLPLPPGVLLVDVTDPTAPVIQDLYPMPALGAHSVYAGSVPGRTIVIVSVVNLAQPLTNFHFFEVQDTLQGAHMVPLGVYTENPTTAGAPVVNGHNDGVVQRHPLTGQDLAYLANWDQGMNIVDIGTPLLTPVGGWNDNPGPSSDLQRDGIGSVHEAIPIEGLWDGRHYTIIGQEILDHPSQTPSGWVRVLDTTDPTAPFVVAEWTLPVDVFWDEQLVFSTHYVTLHERTLYVAHYHAGVWAVDLSCIPDCEHPPAIGVFVPANVSPSPPPSHLPYDWSPTVMEAVALDNGDLVVFDATSGVYMVRLDTSNPAPAAIWPGYL